MMIIEPYSSEMFTPEIERNISIDIAKGIFNTTKL